MPGAISGVRRFAAMTASDDIGPRPGGAGVNVGLNVSRVAPNVLPGLSGARDFVLIAANARIQIRERESE